jgi:hypothetical protein
MKRCYSIPFIQVSVTALDLRALLCARIRCVRRRLSLCPPDPSLGLCSSCCAWSWRVQCVWPPPSGFPERVTSRAELWFIAAVETGRRSRGHSKRSLAAPPRDGVGSRSLLCAPLLVAFWVIAHQRAGRLRGRPSHPRVLQVLPRPRLTCGQRRSSRAAARNSPRIPIGFQG